ncbi:MAG: dihydroorotate dehydrogenase electron transfer subunit [Firmicutes bacterium]|nr:dihydroorotate dehydrogenase electron transfer subunit [Bacillota bacterium]
MQKQHTTKVIKIDNVAKDTFVFRLELPKFPKIIPGQFLNVRVPGFTLRRPFAICDWDEKNKTVDFGFTVRGDGTRALSNAKVGDTLDVLLPLGNGFDLSGLKDKKIMLIGGGIGAFPLLSVVKNHANCYSFLGFTAKELVLLEKEFKTASKELVVNIGGFVTDDAEKAIPKIKPDVIFACGPEPMLKALCNKKLTIPVFVSLEQRMACGFGACLCCNQRVLVNGEEENLRICCEGPVFKSEDVIWS